MLQSYLHLLIQCRDVILATDFICITSFLTTSISSELAKFRHRSLPSILSSQSKMCQDTEHAFHNYGKPRG